MEIQFTDHIMGDRLIYIASAIVTAGLHPVLRETLVIRPCVSRSTFF